jgi:hypothetical protein
MVEGVQIIAGRSEIQDVVGLPAKISPWAGLKKCLG